MIKFKKQNIMKLANTNKISYYAIDLLRQTTIERLVKEANNSNQTKEALKAIIRNNIDILLDLMIK